MYIPDIGELVIYMSAFVGACIGLWTRDMVEKFDYVHAFEPFGDSGDCLIQNLHNKENYQYKSKR